VYRELKALAIRSFAYVQQATHCLNNQRDWRQNCFIPRGQTRLQPFVASASKVVLWSGGHFGHHSQIKGTHVFSAPGGVVLSGHCLVECIAFGNHATIRNHVQLREGKETLVRLWERDQMEHGAWSGYRADERVRQTVQQTWTFEKWHKARFRVARTISDDRHISTENASATHLPAVFARGAGRTWRRAAIHRRLTRSGSELALERWRDVFISFERRVGRARRRQTCMPV